MIGNQGTHTNFLHRRLVDQLIFTCDLPNAVSHNRRTPDMVLKSSRKLLAASAMALALSPFAPTAASAQYNGYQTDVPPPAYPATPPVDQDRGPPPPGYSDGQQPGYDNGPAPGYAQQNADVPPPPGYDGSQTPPPPPGYQASPADLAMRDRDTRYASDAEAWARDNCVKSHGNAATGAIIGGVLGALLGNGLAGRHDRGAGTFAGAAVGAVGGAAIAGSAGNNQTSLGCPPGYVVRRDARPYAYDDVDYDYAAPGWYRPWVYVGGSWDYRPYPYHNWYYRTYRGGGYGRRGYGYWHGGGHGGYYRR